MTGYLPVRLTLFTRKNCSLCTEASTVVARSLRLIQPRVAHWDTIDIDEPRHKKWKMYDFDVPVLHVDRVSSSTSPVRAETTTDCVRKLMHRLKEEDVKRLIDEVAEEKGT